jgi:hypothetical protein
VYGYLLAAAAGEPDERGLEVLEASNLLHADLLAEACRPGRGQTGPSLQEP